MLQFRGVGQPIPQIVFGITEEGYGIVAKAEKKEELRRQIISAAKIYSAALAGKNFLYVYGNEFFEVLFLTDRFLHLTGVESKLKAKDFYNKAKDGTLDAKQFYFTPAHPMGIAKNKLPCLNRLPELTNTMVCIVKNMATYSLTYTLGMTNLEFTLGLTEHVDDAGNKLDEMYLPRTLRVKDRAIDVSQDGEIVDFIFMKDASLSKYNQVLFADKGKQIPETVFDYLDPMLYSREDSEQAQK